MKSSNISHLYILQPVSKVSISPRTFMVLDLWLAILNSLMAPRRINAWHISWVVRSSTDVEVWPSSWDKWAQSIISTQNQQMLRHPISMQSKSISQTRFPWSWNSMEILTSRARILIQDSMCQMVFEGFWSAALETWMLSIEPSSAKSICPTRTRYSWVVPDL